MVSLSPCRHDDGTDAKSRQADVQAKLRQEPETLDCVSIEHEDAAATRGVTNQHLKLLSIQNQKEPHYKSRIGSIDVLTGCKVLFRIKISLLFG